jgi:hypothetical protein
MSGPGLQPISGHTPGIGLLSIGAWKFASIVPAVEISLIHVRRDESEFVTAGAMSVRQFWSCQKNDRKPDIKSCKKTVQAYCVAPTPTPPVADLGVGWTTCPSHPRLFRISRPYWRRKIPGRSWSPTTMAMRTDRHFATSSTRRFFARSSSLSLGCLPSNPHAGPTGPK